jgi:ubiquinone/menaquinone biosynthesis C-methylase UbiE
MEQLDSARQFSYWADSKHDEYHRRQFTLPYRSTVHLADFMESEIGAFEPGYRALDVCCGMASNIFYFGHRFPQVHWVGVDLVKDLLVLGRRIIGQESKGRKKPELHEGDALNLSATFPKHSFQVVTSIQTLLCMSDPANALDNLFSMCAPGGWIFISSLFTDFLVDVQMKIQEYPGGDFRNSVGPAIYNVYCIEKFRADCLARGASQFKSVDFEIDIELPVPANRIMGTFTVDTMDQKRLQISGPVLMPWKFVAIQKGAAT